MTRKGRQKEAIITVVAISIRARKVLGEFDRTDAEAERVLGADPLHFSAELERVTSRDLAEVVQKLQTIVAQQRRNAERRARLQVWKVELQSMTTILTNWRPKKAL